MFICALKIKMRLKLADIVHCVFQLSEKMFLKKTMEYSVVLNYTFL